MPSPQQLRLGNHLLLSGLLTPQQLLQSLQYHKTHQCRIGESACQLGFLTPYQLSKALAKQQQHPFANLAVDPPDHELLQESQWQTYLKIQAIPWKQTHDNTIIATTQITPQTKQWAKQHYTNPHFVICTQRDLHQAIQDAFPKPLDNVTRFFLEHNLPELSARKLRHLTSQQAIMLTALAALIILALLIPALGIAILGLVNLLYGITLLFKACLFVIGWSIPWHKRYQPDISKLTNNTLPTYTILIPLFKESSPKTLGTMLAALENLDYPKAKLDVKCILEADDVSTYQALTKMKPRHYIEIIRVPFSMPRTKPKACNYALPFAKGAYTTIYDAEDIPDPYQLKKVVQTFRESGDNLGCVQARLNYYNRKENWLTRFFAIEYASWFDFMLYGLEKLRMPIPLGGTSNHIPTHILKQLYAWDPFNVTEDADLGIRLSEAGYKTRVLDSLTMEEAPISLKSWIKQRTRWIKGYMQTFLVHIHSPKRLYKAFGIRGLTGLILFIGAPSLIYLLTPAMLLLSAASITGLLTLPSWLLQIVIANLILMAALHTLIGLVVIWRTRWWSLILSALAFPFYWILHFIASLRALSQLYFAPFNWEKTEHGISSYFTPGTKPRQKA